MDIYEEIVLLRQQGRRGAVATIVNVRGSIPSFETAKMLVRDDGSIVREQPEGTAPAAKFSRALRLPRRSDLLTRGVEFHHQLAMDQKRLEPLLRRQAPGAGQQCQPSSFGNFRFHDGMVPRAASTS